MKGDAASIAAVTQLLGSWSFQVSRVPTAEPKRRADLAASIASEHYMIEVKSKVLSDFYTGLMREADRAGTATGERIVGYDNVLSHIIRDAEEQLTSTPAPAESLKIAWFISLQPDAGYILPRLQATLYGIVPVTAFPLAIDRETMFSLDPQRLMRDCFYYTYGEFFRSRRIDAAVLSGPAMHRLCVNNFGADVDRIRRSSLYAQFAGSRAVIDPDRLEEQGQALIIRGEIDRKRSRAQWDYLAKHYGLQTAPATDVYWSGIAALASEGERGAESGSVIRGIGLRRRRPK